MKKFLLFILTALILTGCAAQPVETGTDPIPVPETSAPLPETTEAPPETNPPETSPVSGGVGGPYGCIHSLFIGNSMQDNSFHSIDSHLISYVGDERYSEWRDEIETRRAECMNDTECPYRFMTIAGFIKYFDIPREAFEAINNAYLLGSYDYNLDVLYSGDDAKIEEYYTSDRTDAYVRKHFALEFKYALDRYVRTNCTQARLNWIDAKRQSQDLSTTPEPLRRYAEFTGNVNQCSAAELIAQFEIPRSEAEKALASAQAWYGSKYPIDLDSLYRDAASETVFTPAADRAYLIDTER